MPKYSVIVQKWEESERGWGTRPDGWSMHASHQHRDRFVHAVLARQFASNGPEAPDCYTRVDGNPYLMPVDKKTYDKVLASEDGIYGDGNSPPEGQQGTTGWVSVPPQPKPAKQEPAKEDLAAKVERLEREIAGLRKQVQESSNPPRRRAKRAK